MNDQDIVTEVHADESGQKQWVTPDLFEVAAKDVTASIYATSGNDGTFGFSNVS